MNARGLSTVGVFGAAGLLIVALGPAGMTEGSTEENPKEVQVMNTAATPVPTRIVGGTAVSGTIGAAQSGPWNVGATQSGTWSVAVSNLPAVQRVELAAPELDSGRLAYSIDTLGEAVELVVPAGSVLTDLVATPRHFGDFQCALDVFEGVGSGASPILRTIPTTHELFTLHLGTGYRGPVTIRIQSLGFEDGHCNGEIFWTGYRLP